jgi:hypothetical protein
MPRRTNAFQQVVTILHAHVSGDATVEESAMLVNRVTGEEREVDVVIRSRLAGHEVAIGVEATMMKGNSPWVERMIGKHVDLPTDRLVLVAEKGFSKPAERYAERKGVATITPRLFDEADPELRIVGRVQRMWPKGVEMTPIPPEELRIWVRKPDGSALTVRDAPLDGLLYFADGAVITTHGKALSTLFESDYPRIAQLVDLEEVTADRDDEKYLQLGNHDAPYVVARRGGTEPAYLRWLESDPPEFHQVISLIYHVRVVITVAEVELTHRRFDRSNVAYGTAPIAGKDSLFVVTEGDYGIRMTIQPEQPHEAARKTPDAGPSGYAIGTAKSGDPDESERGS